jgi:hypothetical protein
MSEFLCITPTVVISFMVAGIVFNLFLRDRVEELGRKHALWVSRRFFQ